MTTKSNRRIALLLENRFQSYQFRFEWQYLFVFTLIHSSMRIGSCLFASQIAFDSVRNVHRWHAM